MCFHGNIELRKPTQAEEVSVSRHSTDGFVLETEKQADGQQIAGNLKVCVSVITDNAPLSQEEITTRQMKNSRDKVAPTSPSTLTRAPAMLMTSARDSRHSLPALPAIPLLDSCSDNTSSTNQVEVEVSKRPLGRVLGKGEYFGDKPGGVVHCLEECQLLMVPRCHVASSLSSASEDEMRSRSDFLQQWLPGADMVDSETFRVFSKAFRCRSFPKGYVFCSERRSKLQQLRRVFLVISGELSDLGDTTAAPPDPEWEPGSRANCCHFEKGAAVLARRIGKGAIVGFHSALFEMQEPRTVVAATCVEAWVIDAADLPCGRWPQAIVSKLASYMDRRKGNLPNVSERSRHRQTQLRSTLGFSASLPNVRGSMQRQSLAASLTCLKPPRPISKTRLSESWQYVTAFC